MDCASSAPTAAGTDSKPNLQGLRVQTRAVPSACPSPCNFHGKPSARLSSPMAVQTSFSDLWPNAACAMNAPSAASPEVPWPRLPPMPTRESGNWPSVRSDGSVRRSRLSQENLRRTSCDFLLIVIRRWSRPLPGHSMTSRASKACQHWPSSSPEWIAPRTCSRESSKAASVSAHRSMPSNWPSWPNAGMRPISPVSGLWKRWPTGGSRHNWTRWWVYGDRHLVGPLRSN